MDLIKALKILLQNSFNFQTTVYTKSSLLIKVLKLNLFFLSPTATLISNDFDATLAENYQQVPLKR